MKFVTKRQCLRRPAIRLCSWCDDKCLPGNIKEVCTIPEVYIRDCYPTRSPTENPTPLPTKSPKKSPSQLPTTKPSTSLPSTSPINP